jgi:prepilin-type N-terminal cleavage/methylation domain-containing protein/prepilin-type processing-associated H-X9-DG protein
MSDKETQTEAGFSLLEVLIVVALLVILTAMYWGSATGTRERTKLESCQQNLEKIFIALQIYANDSGGQFPVISSARTAEDALDGLVPRYTVDTARFICPGSRDPGLPSGESFRQRKISYAYYMGRKASDTQEALLSDRQINALSKTAGEPTFSNSGEPPGNNHRKSGGNFLFVDGHVAASPPNTPFSLPITQGVSLLNPKP